MSVGLWLLWIVSALAAVSAEADEVLVGRLLDNVSGGDTTGKTGHQFAMETLRRLDASIVPQVNDRLERALARPDRPADNLLEVLEAHPDPRSVPVLIRCLDDPALRIQTRAVQLLGVIGDPTAVEPLLIYSRRAPDLQREQVITAVIRIGGSEAKRFIRHLLGQPEFDAAQHALAAYRLWKDESIVPVLLERLENARQSSERIQDRITTAWTLGMLGNETGRDELIEILEKDARVWSRRQFVIAALGEVGGAEVERALVGRISEADEDERISLLHALADSGGAIARRELRLHATSRSRRVQQEALSGLAGLGELEPAWEHWKALREQPWSRTLQDWIAFYVNRLQDERIVPDLLEWFEEAQGVRREALLRMLGHAGDPRAIPGLVDVLLNEAPDPRGDEPGRSPADLASEALANCGPEVVPALKTAWSEDLDEPQRRRVLLTMRNVGDRLGQVDETRAIAQAAFDWAIERFELSPEDRQIFLIEAVLPGFYDIRFGRWVWEQADSSEWTEPVRDSLERAKRRFF